MIKEVYLIPTYRCNLNCPHCQITHTESDEDFEKFLQSYRDINGGAQAEENREISYILFGGEPCINGYDRIKRIIDLGKEIKKPICTTTSNLLLMSGEIMDLLISNNVIIGTSWNPHRFTKEQEELWFGKIEELARRNVNVALFVTMTYDLFKSDFPKVMDRLDSAGNVASLTLNPYIPGTETLRRKTDEYLCGLEDQWRWRIRFLMREAYLKTRKLNGSHASAHSCSGVVTIQPDGTVKPGCAHEGHEHYAFDECKSCRYKYTCLSQKCPKQPCCNFFKKFFNKLLMKYPTSSDVAYKDLLSDKLLSSPYGLRRC